MLAIFLAAWVIIYIISRIFSLEKYGIEIHPLYLLFRTERFNRFLENLANRRPRLLRTFWNMAVAVAVGAAATVAVGVPMEVSDGVAVGFEPNGLPCVAIRPAMADTSSTTIPRSPASILVITGPSYHCCI